MSEGEIEVKKHKNEEKMNINYNSTRYCNEKVCYNDDDCCLAAGAGSGTGVAC